MLKKKKCFCEFGFLEEIQQYLISENILDRDPTLENYRNIYRFLYFSDLSVDMTTADTEHISNNVAFLALYKASKQNKLKIEFLRNDFPNLDESISPDRNDEILNSIFLTTKSDEECIKLSQRYGIIVLNRNLSGTCDYLFDYCEEPTPGYDISKKEDERLITDWNFLKKRFPDANICNSIIINESYFFNDDITRKGRLQRHWRNKINDNLKPILDIFLPDKCTDRPFNLLILTVMEHNKRKNNDVIVESSEEWLKIRHSYLKKIIQSIRPELQYNLCIILQAKHDRAIITNNIAITSGTGFSIFSKTEELHSDSTTIRISHPFVTFTPQYYYKTRTDNLPDNGFILLITRIQKILNNISEENLSKYCGNYKSAKNNSIIKYYSKSE